MLKSIPRLDESENNRLPTIPGNPPNLLYLPKGCPFYARCEYRLEQCENQRPQVQQLNSQHEKACHLSDIATAEKTTEILV